MSCTFTTPGTCKTWSSSSKINRAAQFWLGLVFWPWLLVGQTNDPSVTYPANRYLLVVETSSSMQRRADSMMQSVKSLLASAVAAQSRPADSLGVWTVDEQVHTGLLPLQQLSPNNQKTVSDRVLGLLKNQKFEKRARLDTLIAALDRVTRASAFITIVIICTGDDEIHGTPFDQRINDLFRDWHQKGPDAGRPFTIALRGQAGKLVDCSMNPFPWPADLPPLPKELYVPVPTPRPLAAEPRKTNPPVPPLIISGKKRELRPSSKVLETAGATNLVVAPSPTLASEPRANSAVAIPQNNSGNAAGTSAGQSLQTNAVSVSVPVLPAGPSIEPSRLAPPLGSNSPPPASPSAIASHLPPADSTSVPPSAKLPIVAGKLSRDAVPAEVAVSGTHRSNQSLPIACGIGVAALGITAAIWMWLRRSRPVRDTSLITESIKRRDN